MIPNQHSRNTQPNPARRIAAALALAALSLTAACGSHASTEPTRAAINAAHRYLITPEAGKLITGVVHLGATYQGHDYLKTDYVLDSSGDRRAGHFKLLYRFRWEPNGHTTLAFRCDPAGRVYGVEVVESDAFLNQPFLWAKASIHLLGDAVLDQFKQGMDDADRRLIHDAVQDADVQSLLAAWLRIAQNQPQS